MFFALMFFKLVRCFWKVICILNSKLLLCLVTSLGFEYTCGFVEKTRFFFQAISIILIVG